MEPQPPAMGTDASDASLPAWSAERIGHRRQQAASLWAATELAHDLDVDRLAQRVVEGVTEVTDYITKPFDIDELLHFIKYLQTSA